MNRFLYIILILTIVTAGALAACTTPGEPQATVQPTQQTTPTAAPLEISQSGVAFVFSEEAKNSYISLYHQLAYIKMESQGYNLSSIYVTEQTDFNATFNSLKTNGTKYVVVTESSLYEHVMDYMQNSSDLIFIQYGDFYENSIFSYDIKLYEYYYLAGVALGYQSQSHIAGFIAKDPGEQTIRCINAFALGMKEANEDSVVVVSWADDAVDENHISQLVDTLIYQQCDVFAYFMDGDLTETVSGNAGADYMTMSTHTLLNSDAKLKIKPNINLDTYFAGIINLEKTPTSNELDFLDVRENIVFYELSDTVPETTRSQVQNAYQNIQNGFEVFSGPIYNDIGLIVPEGSSLPESDILDMLWFVDNIVGELPAG